MLVRVFGIEADEITHLLALGIDDVERLSSADPRASSLIGRYQDFFNYLVCGHGTITCLICLFYEYCDGTDGGAGASADPERKSEIQETLLGDQMQIAQILGIGHPVLTADQVAGK